MTESCSKCIATLNKCYETLYLQHKHVYKAYNRGNDEPQLQTFNAATKKSKRKKNKFNKSLPHKILTKNINFMLRCDHSHKLHIAII